MNHPAAGSQAFFFLHLYKTAGTSINHTLEYIFPREQICPAWNWEQLLQMPKEQLQRYTLFRGHLYGDLPRHVGRPMREFTILRDPIIRALSHYDQRLREDPAPHNAAYRRPGSFSAALRTPSLKHSFGNFQARHLAKQIYSEDHPSYTDVEISDADLFDSAKRRLDAMECVGVTERYGEFVAAMCHVFDWDAPSAERRVNVKPIAGRGVAMSTADRDLLVAMNAVDFAIYQEAEKRLTRSVEAMYAHRKADPEEWTRRLERRIAKLDQQITVQEARIAESNMLLPAIAIAATMPLQRFIDRLMPFGTRARNRVRPFGRWMRRIFGAKG